MSNFLFTMLAYTWLMGFLGHYANYTLDAKAGEGEEPGFVDFLILLFWPITSIPFLIWAYSDKSEK